MKVLIKDSLLASLEEGREYKVHWVNDIPYIISHVRDDYPPDTYNLNDLAYYHVYFDLIKEKEA